MKDLKQFAVNVKNKHETIKTLFEMSLNFFWGVVRELNKIHKEK